jgi:hypothetical protein
VAGEVERGGTAGVGTKISGTGNGSPHQVGRGAVTPVNPFMNTPKELVGFYPSPPSKAADTPP